MLSRQTRRIIKKTSRQASHPLPCPSPKGRAEKTTCLSATTQPCLIAPFLLLARLGHRNNSIRPIDLPGQAYVERAHVVKTKHHYAHRITRTLRREERFERVFVYAGAVQRDNLVLRVQALLVRGRTGANALDRDEIAVGFVFKIGAQ